MKKLICYLTIISLSLCLFAIPSYAIEDFGNFSYWYSDTGKIGYVPSTVKVLLTKDSTFSMSDSDYLSMCNFGFNAWQSVINRSIINGSSSDYNLLMYGISRSTANSIGIPSNYSSSTIWVSDTLVGVGKYLSVSKNVYNIQKTHIYHVWDSTTQYYSNPKWSAISAHEYGHAVGYAGHDVNANSSNKSLMNYTADTYYDQWGVSTPQTRDANHLGQVY